MSLRGCVSGRGNLLWLSEMSGGFPRQCAHWLGMTMLFILPAVGIVVTTKLQVGELAGGG